MDGVATYVRDEWSQHGVEVGSRGERSLTLKLPPELPALTELVAELWDKYGATVSLKHTEAPSGANLTVRMPLDAPTRAVEKPTPIWSSAVMVVAVLSVSFASILIQVAPEWPYNISGAK
jgi:hypothetical protein